MRLAIVTKVWKRPEVFELWAAGIKRLYPLADVTVCVAGSEGYKSREMVERHGFNYVETPNEPLGYKSNQALRLARLFDPDFVLFLGSDDLISTPTLAYILERTEEADLVEPMDLYIYDSESKRVMHSRGYENHRKGESLAVGRCLSAKILDKLDWELWDNMREKFLDGSSRDKLSGVSVKRHTYRLKEIGGFILDVKTKDNLSPFVVQPNWEEERQTILNDHLPTSEVMALMRL